MKECKVIEKERCEEMKITKEVKRVNKKRIEKMWKRKETKTDNVLERKTKKRKEKRQKILGCKKMKYLMNRRKL